MKRLGIPLVLTMLLVSCGGGSDSSPPPNTSVEPPTATPATPSGKLWHHDKNLVGQDGSAVSDATTGAYRTLSTYRFPIPARDGSRYLEEHYSSSDRTTEIWIRQSSDNSVIDKFVVDGAITDVEFSPVTTNLIRMNWGENALSYSTHVVFDLAAKRVIWADDDRSRTRDIAWLPDGRVLSISSRGVISAFTTADVSQKTVLGSLALPTNKLPLDIATSPRGDKMLVEIAELDTTGAVLRRDYWLGSLDGSGLRQMTDAGGRASKPIFSPDGQFVAFQMGYGTSDLVSACDLRYTSISAQKVSRTSADAKEFLGMKDFAGKVYPFGLGCELVAWLP